ncbi:hypothetical protein L7F22_053399 [Adiantum nelumboides]|nr:hypothetical protein [Adiantum nelumboides]
MAHLLGNNPGQQDAGEILLSGFTHMALQMEAQKRLMKPASKPRRGKKGPKKQPQRGLGVAQLEKIRLEEQRRASQHAQQLAALRQLHSVAPPLFSTSPNAGMQVPAASIIPQLEREINHATMLHTSPQMSSSLAHLPCIDTVSSSFLLSNIPAVGISSSVRSTMRSSASATPLELFPTHKLPATGSLKIPDDIFTNKNSWSLQQLRRENGAFLENPQSSVDLAYDRIKDSHYHGRLSYSLLHMRRNCVPSAELRNSGSPLNQVPNNRMASPSFNLDRTGELSSFQSVMASPTRDQQATFHMRQAWDAVQQPNSELTRWAIPSLAHSKTSNERKVLYRRSEEACELTLRPPGSEVLSCNTSAKGEDGHPNADDDEAGAAAAMSSSSAGGGRLHNFLSLSVGGGSSTSSTLLWEESVADASSSTPSPTTTKTTTTTTSTTDEHTSPLARCMPHSINSFSPKSYLLNVSQNSILSTSNVNLDLTLKL